MIRPPAAERPARDEKQCRAGQRRVRDFLRDVLRPHEEDHARRLRTYNGRTVIPLDLTGCGSAELRAQVAAIHDAEAAQRQADADTRSAETDPFTREVDLDCG